MTLNDIEIYVFECYLKCMILNFIEIFDFE